MTSNNDEISTGSAEMDELLRKYDEVIKDFTEVLDAQTRKILGDPKLEQDK